MSGHITCASVRRQHSRSISIQTAEIRAPGVGPHGRLGPIPAEPQLTQIPIRHRHDGHLAV
jgi:hypothetical protein